MASTAHGTRDESRPREGNRPREWRPLDLIVLAIAAIALFILVFWAALGWPPLAGITVVGVLGFLFAILANLSLGALACGAVVEYRHPGWTRLRGFDHVFLYVALVLLIVMDGGVLWWLLRSGAGGSTPWIVLAASLAAAAGGAWWARPAMPRTRRPADGGNPRWALWPHHRPDAPPGELWRCFTPLSALLGSAVGVLVAVAYLGLSAWSENAAVPPLPPLPAAPAGLQGGYVALGDSYSAGEGLPPFAPGTAATNCDQSLQSAYPDLLARLLNSHGRQVTLHFAACSGAVIGGILGPAHRPGGLVPPQISNTVQPSVRLVTLTIGGNNAIFSKVVAACVTSGNCLEATFPPPGVSEATAHPVPPGQMLTQWGPATIEEIGRQDATLFRVLRHDFPGARIIVLGYPYLFPTRPAPGFPFYPPECASILNRLSVHERAGIRTLQDDFNDRTYEEAVSAGIEFVSTVAVYAGHEPCGTAGQYTNSVKPYLSFPNPVNGGSFHPNAAGQQALAGLLACYLDSNPVPPDPFASGTRHPIAIPAAGLADPRQLGLLPSPGLDAVPGAGTIPGC